MPSLSENHVLPSLLCGLVLWCFSTLLHAQDLEPRRWSHLPEDLNVLGAAAVSVSGDILFDPVLLIEDATFDVYTVGLSYVHSFGLAGKTARIDVVAPIANGRWEGLVDGEETSVRRKGLIDPWVRFSVNLYGAPALKGEEYLQYRTSRDTHTIVGAAVSVFMPLGQYSEEYLINLGENRWRIRPQLGVLHQRKKWQFEVTGSVFLHGDNNEFWQGNVLKRDPLWFVQSHAIYTIKQGWWTSLSAGFAHGGRSSVNGSPKTDDARTSFTALSMGASLSRQQNLKFTYLRRRTNISIGNDSDYFSVGWSYSWFN
jgi:hypothetical protein